MTKSGRLIFLLTALVWIITATPTVRGADEKTFKGEIADTQCALNVHSLSQSHREMIEMKPEVKTDADCARFCVKERGGRFVLQIKDKVYKLDKQELAEPYAGARVKIIGILDPKTDAIAVRSIEPIAVNPSGAARPK